MKLTKFRIFLGLTLGYAALIFYLSSISDLNLPRAQLHLLNDIIRNLMHSDYAFLLAPLSPLILQQDKVLHIILFFGFGLLIYLTLRSGGKTVVNAFIFAILLGSLYGVSDEFHQMFVPHRTASDGLGSGFYRDFVRSVVCSLLLYFKNCSCMHI